MVYSTHGESDTLKVEVPASKQQLSVAIYLTDNKTLSHANITEYTAGTQADTSADGATDASTTDGTTDATPDPGAADTVTPVSYTHLDVYKRQDNELSARLPRHLPHPQPHTHQIHVLTGNL